MALFYDRATRKTEARSVASWRRELLDDAHGEVLELGAGTGLNIPCYDRDKVTRLVLSEPDRHMRQRLSSRLTDSGVPAEIDEAPADRLPFPDASFDCVVSTLVLCTVPDLHTAIAEIRRVLKPGGALFVIEHVAAEHDARLYRWQRRLEPLWRWWAEGCHLTRCTAEAITDAGFRFETLVDDEMLPAPAVVRRVIRGIARL